MKYYLDLCYCCDQNCVKSPFHYISDEECCYNVDQHLVIEKYRYELIDIVIEE